MSQLLFLENVISFENKNFLQKYSTICNSGGVGESWVDRMMLIIIIQVKITSVQQLPTAGQKLSHNNYYIFGCENVKLSWSKKNVFINK